MGDVAAERTGGCWAKGEKPAEAYGDSGVAESMVDADDAECPACGAVRVVEMVGGCARPLRYRRGALAAPRPGRGGGGGGGGGRWAS